VERGGHALPEDVCVVGNGVGEYGGVFVLSGADEPKSFNFLVSLDHTSSQAQGYLFNALIDFNPMTQSFEPALAKSWEVAEDHRHFRFELRKGVCWSDGVPLTADDVIFTWDCIFDKSYPNRYAGQFTIGGEALKYEKVDDFTVVFETAKPFAPFLNDISSIQVLPKHCLWERFQDGTLLEAWSMQTAIDDPRSIVGTGPFTIDRYHPSEYILLRANPHYWKADKKGQRLPYIDFLITQFVSDVKTQVILFATGQTDASNIPSSDVVWVQAAAKTYDFTLYNRGPDGSISFIWFNQHPGSRDGKLYIEPYKLKWFQNQAFRQAIMYGFNRQGLLESVYSNDGRPIHSIIAEANIKWYNPHVRQYPYDPGRARALLAQNGFRLKNSELFDMDGHSVAFSLIVNDGSPLTSGCATTFCQNMEALGIHVRVQYLDFGALLDKVSNNFDYEASIMGFTGGGDPSGGKAIYRSDGNMHLWYPNQKQPATQWEAEVDAIWEQQESEFDEDKRIALIHRMQAIFSEQLPLLFLNTPNRYTGVKNKWHNVQIPPMDSMLWNIDCLWERPLQNGL